MAQHKQRSRIAQFKSPFLVGIASAGAVLSGCGAKTESAVVNPEAIVGTPGTPSADGKSGATNSTQTPPAIGGTSNPPGVFWTCPATTPAPGDACPDYIEGRECGGDTGPVVRCVSGKWQSSDPVVTAPEPVGDCPDETPRDGETCAAYEPDLDCNYADDSSCPRNFTCSDGEWSDVSPTCNPPPPEPTTECPELAPSAGAPCYGYALGLVCTYDDAFGCPLHEECDEGIWTDVSPGCIDSASLVPEVVSNPPAPDITSNPPAPDITTECPTAGSDGCGSASVPPDGGSVSNEPDGG